MAYDKEDLARVKHVQELAKQVDENYTKKSDTKSMADRVQDLENHAQPTVVAMTNSEIDEICK